MRKGRGLFPEAGVSIVYLEERKEFVPAGFHSVFERDICTKDMHQVAPFHRIRTAEILAVWAKSFAQVDKSESQVKVFLSLLHLQGARSLLTLSS